MLRILKTRGFFLVGVVVLMSGTYIAASGAAGQLFRANSDGRPHQDTLKISIQASGGSGENSTNLSFYVLLPGALQTVSVNYKNTGNTPASVWAVFPNATALSALNTLGHYGAVHLSSAGASAVGDVFDSTNLNDNSLSCGTFSQTDCWPLSNQYEVAQSIAPGSSGTFSFGFEFASAYSVQPTSTSTAQWNRYPVPGQTTVVSSDGAGFGLPYDLVAVPPGIIPGQPGTIIQRHPFGETVPSPRSGDEFSDHLKVEGSQATMTFFVTSPNPHLEVTSDGKITTVAGPLAPGTYSVSGTISDASNDTGTWTYTLTVTAVTHH